MEKPNPPLAGANAGEERQRSIALVIGPEPSLHSAFLALEPFRAANRTSGTTIFTIEFLPADPEIAVTSMGVTIPVTETFESSRRYDLVLLHVTYDIDAKAKPRLFRWLRRQSAAGAHVCGVDTGSLLLAEAGLLDGHAATCHWTALASLRELLPGGKVLEQIFVTDRNRSTCAGQVATLDFSMEMLRNICGEKLYQLVANELIYTKSRAPDVKQRELVNERSWLSNPILNRAQQIMKETVEYPIEMERVAERCGVSARELQYLFQRYLNTTPKKIYMAFRLQHAKELLLYSHMSIRETGLACGFATPSAFYRAFHAIYQKSPQEYRTDFAKSQSKMYGRNLY